MRKLLDALSRAATGLSLGHVHNEYLGRPMRPPSLQQQQDRTSRIRCSAQRESFKRLRDKLLRNIYSHLFVFFLTYLLRCARHGFYKSLSSRLPTSAPLLYCSAFLWTLLTRSAKTTWPPANRVQMPNRMLKELPSWCGYISADMNRPKSV